MAQSAETTVIKKYANRRLYNTGTSTYVTLEDLATMVKNEEDFVVFDAKSSEDITRSVLTQIIFEQEGKGHNLLPIAFLRQLIRFYGDSMQSIVPSFLEHSLASFTRDSDKFRQQVSQAFGTTGFDTIEEQVRRNTEMFEKAIRMFNPFAAEAEAEAGEADTAQPDANTKTKAQAKSKAVGKDIDGLRQQMVEMQKKLDSLADDN